MTKALIAALAMTMSVAVPALAASVPTSASPGPGPVYALQPTYMAVFGVPPDQLGLVYRMTEVSKTCWVTYPNPAYPRLFDSCVLPWEVPLGTPCGCPPPAANTPWQHGTAQ